MQDNVSWIAIGGLIAVFAWLAGGLTARRSFSRRTAAGADARASLAFRQGLRALCLGRHAEARTLLEVAASGDEHMAALARIAAACAATWRGDDEAARLLLVGITDRHADIRAVGVANLALRRGRPEAALEALDVLEAEAMPPAAAALRVRALLAAGRAEEAAPFLEAAGESLSNESLDALRRQHAKLVVAGARSPDDLACRWAMLPDGMRRTPEVVIAYADRMNEIGWLENAVEDVEQTLESAWHEDLLVRYAAMPVVAPSRQQAMLEKWASVRKGSVQLPIALARLYRHQGRRRESEWQLIRAAIVGSAAEAWEELGNGYAEEGQEALARVCYANALRVCRGRPPFGLPRRTATVAAGGD